jgi:competence protein ComEA
MITPEPSILERFRQVYEKQEHKRLLSFVREARTPLLLFAICMMIGIYFCYRSIILVTASIQKETELKKPAAQSDISSSTQKVKWYVDLSGAVMKPQTYEVEQGTRVFQLIERAGGLSPEADRPYIQRNYNFSVLLSDQQVSVLETWNTAYPVFSSSSRKGFLVSSYVIDSLRCLFMYGSDGL